MHAHVKAFDIDWNELNDSDKKTKAIKAIYTSKGKIAVDSNTEVIIAAGSWTPKLLWLCGYFAPIYPMKGYSVAIDLPPEGSDNRPEESAIPSRMLIDQKLYISRLGNQIRITSMGEFCGWDTKPDYTIDRIFREAGKIRVPGLKPLFDASPTRCGLRPYSADGIIILGRIEDTTNLSVNVGPGFNGWKISIGAANVLATILTDGNAEKFDFDFKTFYPSKRIVPAPIWAYLSRIRWST